MNVTNLSRQLADAEKTRLLGSQLLYPRREIRHRHFTADVVRRDDLGEVHIHLSLIHPALPAPRTPKEAVQQQKNAAAAHEAFRPFLEGVLATHFKDTRAFKIGWFPEVKLWGICNTAWLKNPLLPLDATVETFLQYLNDAIEEGARP